MWSSRAGLVLALGISALAVAAPAPAAMPGVNGKIAFQSDRDGNIEVYAMDPDGAGQANLTNSPTGDYTPAWSPDGQRLVIACSDASEFCLRNADGSGSDRFFTGGMVFHPSWSPGGTRITFEQEIFFCDPPDDPNECELSWQIAAVDPDGTGFSWVTENGLRPSFGPAWSPRGDRIAFDRSNLHTIRPDGTSETPLPVFGEDANWSPDGAKIAYTAGFDSNLEIFVANADGSGAVRLTTNAVQDRHPAWSPDGTKIAFTSTEGGDAEIFVMNANGTGRQQLTNNAAADSEPDWQPIIRREFPRPKGATPVRVSLVPAYQPCTAPDREHGPPLAFGSCNPPTQQSSNLTIGTPDANGAPPNFGAFARFDTVVGNPTTPADEADVRIALRAADIRCGAGSDASACGAANGAGGADYTGELVGAVTLRLTDEHNTPFPDPVTGAGPGTVQDDALSFTAPCAATPSTAIGAACGIDTTADALVPGLVREKDRAIWQLGQMLVFDGGPDGDASTPADSRVFLVQGVFIP